MIIFKLVWISNYMIYLRVKLSNEIEMTRIHITFTVSHFSLPPFMLTVYIVRDFKESCIT